MNNYKFFKRETCKIRWEKIGIDRKPEDWHDGEEEEIRDVGDAWVEEQIAKNKLNKDNRIDATIPF